jgi:dienelactone hydrolase
MPSLRYNPLPVRLALGAVIGAALLCAAPARAEVKTQWVEYNHGDARLKGYMAWDDSKSGKRPAVFMVHAKWCMGGNTVQQAEQWAKLGYVVFAADMFGVIPKTDPETRVQTDIYRKDRALMRARAQAGFDMLMKNPNVDAAKVALIGYCFGGSVGVEVAGTGAPLAATIIIHGSYGNEPGWAKNMKGMFVMLHGAEDPNFPRETDKVLGELRAAKVPFEMQLYSGTAHGFSTPKNKAEERANAQSIATAGRTLKELFGI